MKTKEELNAQNKEVETVNKKLAELNEEELAEVMGGAAGYLEVETVPTDIHSVQMPTPETKEEALHRIEVVTHQKIEEISDFICRPFIYVRQSLAEVAPSPFNTPAFPQF